MRLATQAQAGTALVGTTSTSETVLSSYVFAIGALQVEKELRFRGCVRTPNSVGATTAQIRIRFGPTTLTGTVLLDGTALDAVNDNILIFEFTGTVRVLSATAGEIFFSGPASITGVAGTVPALERFVRISNLNTNVAQRFEITAQISAADATSVQVEQFSVDEYVVGKG